MKKIITLFACVLGAHVLAQPTGWLYNQPISVTNNNTVNAVDYQLKITVNTQSLISAGQMLANGNDIRFGGTCTGNTFYNYWIEGGINTATTAVWVKIPMIAAGTTSTIFMFYGNSGATAVSTIPGTFRGPSSSTDSVTGGSSGGLLVCQRGFRFSPNQPLLVTHFGKYEPAGTTRYVTLFNYSTQAILSQTQVSGPAATYSYGPIPNPIWLNTGTQYVLQIYGLATDGYYYGSSTQIGQHLTYVDMQYSNGGTQNTFPNSTLSNYHYGYGDFLYYITSTLAITPTYTFSQIGNISTGGPLAAICSGNNATLTANMTGSGTYSWSTGGSGSVIVVAPTSNTTYSVTFTNTTGCTMVGLVTVTVNSGVPVLTVNSSTNQTCLGKDVTLTASGGLSHTWSGGVINGVPFTPTATGNYSVVAANGCGTTSAVTSITVAPLPVAAVASSTLVCQLNTATLTAGGATNYTWAPGNQTLSTIVVAPAANTIYTVTASDGTCQGVATLTVNTKPNPTITVVASSSNICAGESATVTASGADTYSWTPAVISGSTGVVTPTAPVLYQVSGTNAFGCTTGAAQVIIVKASPNIFASGNPTLICAGGSVTLTATGNADSYTWSTGSGGASTVVTPTIAGTYTVTGTIAASGCSSTQVVAISVFEPVLPVSPSTTICAGSLVTLTAGPGTGYVWSNGSSFPSINVSPTVSTSYSVSAMTVSNNVSCLSSNTIQVDVNPKPLVTAVASRSVMCRFEKITVTAGGANTYSWSNNTTGATLTFSSNVIMLHNLFVIGVDANGCSDTTSFQLRVNSCTGLEELNSALSGLQIYPNPNRGEFTISAASEASLLLMNELGQVVRTVSLDRPNDYKVNVKDLAEGVYLISGTINGKAVSQKIIVGK